MSADARAAMLVDRLTAELAPLEREASEAWWKSNVEASEQAEARRIELEQRVSDRYAVAADLAELEEVARGGIGDPLLARSVEVLRLSFAGEQLPVEQRSEMVRLGAECDTVYATFRGEAGGRRWTDNEVEQVLAASDDIDEREAAWLASKQVGAAVAERVLRLVEVRNTCARQLGHASFYAMALALGELSEARLFELLDELEQLTAEPFAQLKAGIDDRLAARFGTTRDALMPWHYADAFFQEAPREAALDLDPLVAGRDLTALTMATYDGLGLPLRDVADRSDLVGREGKNQHAFCINIDRGGDVRVLANVVDNERWASTMLHEFGHAAYDVGLRPDLPWSLRIPAHSLTTEAVAQLFGRLSKDPGWLRDIAGVPAADAEALAGDVRAALRASMLVFARWVLVMCHFERDLYTELGKPGFDPDARWWEHVERFQLLRRPPGRADSPDWAAKLHLALAPVYYQNYVLGECLASQLAATVAQRGGRLYNDPATGRWLGEHVFGPGASLRWDHLVTRATGSPLSAAAFVQEFVS
ncbi:MAG TPA: M2 family metallopeptidase [Mycobacteriales bacterium]|nr:M2 family metallopeptidase [Mycobacteriales bacterium]